MGESDGGALDQRVERLVARLTLEEKAALCSGLDFWHTKPVERLGVPSVMLTDGPHGLRKQDASAAGTALNQSVPATCFPTASALAATWNRDLVSRVGAALGREARAQGVGVVLGPGANIKRSPLCGRNFEYFSEDPYLSGEMARSHIAGVQSQGIGASLKHFAVNNQEYRRMTIDAVVDERALREIYLAGFEIAVKGARPWTVMAAYNRVNGVYCSEHRRFLTDILRREWRHTGIVVSDWGAVNDRVAALKAGLELEMPGMPNGNDAQIVQAMRNGTLPESVLDEAVERLLRIILRAEETLRQGCDVDGEAHHALAREVAGEAAVLLKNEGPLLPLASDMQVALIGRFARTPRYQGAGSSLVNPTRLDNAYDEMVRLVGTERVTYAPGYDPRGDEVDRALIEEAVRVAEAADVAVVFAGLTDWYEVEGLDRQHMRLPVAHDALIAAVVEANPNTVVVLSNGAPVEMPWASQVKAILEGYLSGQAGAGALVDILYGRINPSGKLAETFPLRLEDTPCYACFPGGPATVEYRESLYVGYRFYDTVGKPVLFPFGHGLSYTTFEYSGLTLSHETMSDTETLTVRLKVCNSGRVAGKEVVQLYVRDVESSWFRPKQELKGFAKVALEPGEVGEVTFQLDRRAFAYFNPDLGEWHVETGAFEILIGASSRDIRLSATIWVTSTQPSAPSVDRGRLAAYVSPPADASFSREAFQALLGRSLPPNEIHRPYTLNTPLSDMRDSLVGRWLERMIRRNMEQMMAGMEESPTTMLFTAMMRDAPLRLLLMVSQGAFSRDMLAAILLLINRKPLRGLVALIKALWSRRPV